MMILETGDRNDKLRTMSQQLFERIISDASPASSKRVPLPTEPGELIKMLRRQEE